MRRMMVLPAVIGAVVVGMLGPAAPANAQSVESTPLRTLTRGLCVGETTVNVQPGSDPGTLAVSGADPYSVVGMAPFSGECSFELIVRWHNLDTGATGEERLTQYVGMSGCDIFLCWAWSRYTGSGRVAVEVASDLPHTPGHAEVLVP